MAGQPEVDASGFVDLGGGGHIQICDGHSAGALPREHPQRLVDNGIVLDCFTAAIAKHQHRVPNLLGRRLRHGVCPVPLTVAWHAGEPLRRLAGQSPAAGGRQYKRPSYQEHHHHIKDTTCLDMDSMRLTNRRPRHHTIPTPRDICSSLDNTSLPHRRREQSRSHRRHEHPVPAYQHYRSKNKRPVAAVFVEGLTQTPLQPFCQITRVVRRN